jgi:WD40 repeat protein
VAYSRDYTQVGAAAGKIVKVYNVADGKALLSLAHPTNVRTLSFSFDKTKIATGAQDNLVRIWDAATGKELQFFEHGHTVRGAVFHNNNTSVVSASADKTVAVHALSINRVITVGAGVNSLALAPSGSHLLTAGKDKTVKLWNLGNGNNERTFKGADDVVQAVAVSRNNVLLASGGLDKVVRLYQFDNGKELGAFKVPDAIEALAFSPNNQTLVACAGKSLIAWNVQYTPNQPPPPEFGKTIQKFAQGGAAMDVVFSPDSAVLYSAGLDKKVRSWRVALEMPTRNLGHPNMVDAVAFNSTGTQLASVCHDGILRIHDPIKGNLIRQISSHVKPNLTAIYCLAWSPDDKQIATGSIDQSVKIWDAGTGALVRELKPYQEKVFEKGHRDGVFCLAWSPDGKNLATGSADHVIKLWNVSDGTVIRDFVNPKIKPPPMSPAQAHPGWVYGLRFTKDGKQLVSVGDAPLNKGYLAVWTTADGKPAYAEELSLGALYGVAISPDGKHLALACGSRGRANADLNSCYIVKMPN